MAAVLDLFYSCLLVNSGIDGECAAVTSKWISLIFEVSELTTLITNVKLKAAA